MSNLRRNFFKQLLAAGTLQGLIASPGFGRTTGALLDQDSAKDINPDIDAQAYSFWSDFLSSNAQPVVGANGQRRGGPRPDDLQPVFLHYGSDEGFKNAAELDPSKLVSAGDVMVSVNTRSVPADARVRTTSSLFFCITVPTRDSRMPPNWTPASWFPRVT